MEMLELVFVVVELICDFFSWIGGHYDSRRGKRSRKCPSSARRSEPMPDSNRIAAGLEGGSASMPYPYTEFDQWHSM